MPNETSFSASTEGASVTGKITDKLPVIPDTPPTGLTTIGPRVTIAPKGAWDENATYEFYDAVFDGSGNSYIAKKPSVPAGTALTNSDYWMVWTPGNQQLAELQNTVKTFDSRITENANGIKSESETRASAIKSVTDLVNTAQSTADAAKRTYYKGKKAVFMGDSYLALDNNWGNYLKTMLQTDATLIPMSGIGFETDQPTSVAQYPNFGALISAQSVDDSVELFIIQDGWNDSYNYTEGRIKSAMETARIKYPNADIFLVLTFGNCLIDNSRTKNPENYVRTFESISLPTRVGYETSALPVTVINAQHLFLHSSDLMQDDNVHPNDDGSKALANYIYQHIVGCTSIEKPYTSQIFLTDIEKLFRFNADIVDTASGTSVKYELEENGYVTFSLLVKLKNGATTSDNIFSFAFDNYYTALEAYIACVLLDADGKYEGGCCLTKVNHWLRVNKDISSGIHYILFQRNCANVYGF